MPEVVSNLSGKGPDPRNYKVDFKKIRTTLALRKGERLISNLLPEIAKDSTTPHRQSRLALFIPSMGGGGAERVTLTLANQIAARGYPVDLLLAQAEGPYMAALDKSVRLVDLKASRLRYGLPALVSYLRRERPHALLSMLSHTNILTLWARRLAGVSTRVVVSERAMLSCREQPKYWSWLIRHFYRWPDDIIAVSKGVADELVQLAGIPRERIRTIYNPVARPELREKAQAPLNHPWFEPGQPPVLLAVGSLVPVKDFPTLIQAFAQVRQARPVRLIILGEGAERLALEVLVNRLGLEQDVSLPGFVENPYAYMARASVFVLCSRTEGLPGVLIEAMCCGVPIIATDCSSGPREILKDGQYGQLVPVGDVIALAQAIGMALAGKIPPPPRESWQPFDMERMVGQYIRILLGS